MVRAHHHRSRTKTSLTTIIALSTALLACDAQPRSVPPGKLAVVGDEIIGREDLAELLPQLGPYAQYRFAGPEGETTLLRALIDTELLAQEAIKAGFHQDPRLDFVLLEEQALRFLGEQIERRVPADISIPEQTLRSLYQQHRAEFTEPEQRSARGKLYENYAEAEVAWQQLARDKKSVEQLGEAVTTAPAARDDHEYPGFHPALFAAGGVSAILPYPVVVGERLLVGVVDSITPARLRPFEDPEVRARLRELALEQLREQAREQILREVAD